jgi:hypothetical protein
LRSLSGWPAISHAARRVRIQLFFQEFVIKSLVDQYSAWEDGAPGSPNQQRRVVVRPLTLLNAEISSEGFDTPWACHRVGNWRKRRDGSKLVGFRKAITRAP